MTTKRSKKKTSFTHAAGAALLATAMLTGAAPAWAGEAATKCQAGKNAAGGAYFSCLAKAEKEFVAKGDMAKYDETLAKCRTKLQATWDKLEATAVAAGDPCPAQGDLAAVQNLLDGCAGGVSAGASGGTTPSSPLVCQENLQHSNQILSACSAERTLLQSCSCPLSLVLKTGQTTSYGAGSDGAEGRGRSRSFTDNGDGTITDNSTGLMWEKKSRDGSIHDSENLYSWSKGAVGSLFDTMDGTMVTVFLANLNSGGGFAGYTDWRIPNVVELESLRNLQGPGNTPAVYAEFNDSCTDGCTVATCSCMQAGQIWSSTTRAGALTDLAWYMNDNGSTGWYPKQFILPVRAVRAGL